jgi:putative intracellular protease/amidase
MVLLPLLYVSIITARAAAVLWWAVHGLALLTHGSLGSLKIRLFLHLAPLVGGGSLPVFLVKPGGRLDRARIPRGTAPGWPRPQAPVRADGSRPAQNGERRRGDEREHERDEPGPEAEGPPDRGQPRNLADHRVADRLLVGGALFVTGGQSPMVTFRGDAKLQKLVAEFYEAGKVTALVCHGTCLLLETKLSSGALLVAGKTWTGFANSEEQFADSVVGKRIQPLRIEEEARKIPGTNFVVDQRFREFAVRDGRLVTGQQQYSGAAAARLVIEALGR